MQLAVHLLRHFTSVHFIDSLTLAPFAVLCQHPEDFAKERFAQTLSLEELATIARIDGAPKLAAYAAVKHAVVGLTKTAAIEYAPWDSRECRVSVL